MKDRPKSSRSSRVLHSIDPVFDRHSQVLILGTFPSVKSREVCFFYGNPQNRFWKVISAVIGEPCPESVPEKKELLLSHRLAVWDVIKSCEIEGSSDGSIRDVVPNDLSPILSSSDIRLICGNGAKACDFYDRYLLPRTGIEILRLPSTSPANAAWSLERLTAEWGQVLGKVL